MKIKLISNKKYKKLIIYFAGWGTSPELISHLELKDDYDLLICWDYSLNSADFNNNITPFNSEDITKFDFSVYQQVYVVAWSLGVWASKILNKCHSLKIDRAIAINGTEYPIHKDFGIDDKVFSATLNELNEENRAKFERRMCGNKAMLEQYNLVLKRPLLEVKQELQDLYYDILTNAKSDPFTLNINWDKVLIANKDLIFTSKNQLNFWQQAKYKNGEPPRIVQLEGAHFIFRKFTSWEELCRL